MKAHISNLVNALVLIVISGWTYLASETGSLTALVPAVFGLALLACHPGVKSENKTVAHVAVLLTLVVFGALFVPLMGTLDRGDTVAFIRVLTMQATSVLAMVFFVRSFIEARRSRA